jgi:hypothetical protein
MWRESSGRDSFADLSGSSGCLGGLLSQLLPDGKRQREPAGVDGELV